MPLLKNQHATSFLLRFAAEGKKSSHSNSLARPGLIGVSVTQELEVAARRPDRLKGGKMLPDISLEFFGVCSYFCFSFGRLVTPGAKVQTAGMAAANDRKCVLPLGAAASSKK